MPFPAIPCSIVRASTGEVYYLKIGKMQHSMVRQPFFVPVYSKKDAADKPQYVANDFGFMIEQIILDGQLDETTDSGAASNPVSKIRLEDIVANWWKDLDYAAQTNFINLVVGARTWSGFIDRIDLSNKGGERVWQYRISFKSIIPPARV